LDNPEVIEADIAREQELLAERGQQAATEAAGAKQIELPFDGGSDSGAKR
jgi:hypothetical protein